MSHQLGLVTGVFIGIAFGFVLERAGFGRANKLAAQFYLRDMTVFKVMFTAIVTAMLGLVGAAQLGMVNLRTISESIASWTWIWPMLIGGLVLGVGFILSGYCPGTSLVSAASGNVDGMVTVAGVVTGTLLYTKLLQIPSFGRFHESGEKGAWFLYDLIPLPPAVIALAIAAMAVLAFIGAEKVESLLARDKPKRTWRKAVPAFAVLAIATLIPLSPARGEGQGEGQKIKATDLAQRMLAEPWRYSIEATTATDLSTNTHYTIDGVLPKTTAMAVTASPPKPTGTFTKPKKKGGGCSS